MRSPTKKEIEELKAMALRLGEIRNETGLYITLFANNTDEAIKENRGGSLTLQRYGSDAFCGITVGNGEFYHVNGIYTEEAVLEELGVKE